MDKNLPTKRLHVAFDGQLALMENSLSRYTRNLVRHLDAAGSNLKLSLMVFSPRSEAEIRGDNGWIPSSVQLVIMSGKETPYHLPAWERIRRRYLATAWTLNRIGADIFHGHYTDFPIPIGFKVVTTVHDVFQWRPELGRMSGRFVGVRRALDRWLYRRATVVCDSDSTVHDFLHYLDPGHPGVVRVYPGNDPCFTPARSDVDPEILARHSLSLDSKYFLYVGDLSPRKDVKTLILAYREALPQLPPDIKLVLTKGHWTVCPERDLVHALELQDRVQFLGHVPNEDLPCLYRSCLAFVFPSTYEGFGFPPLEAMASGVPVVSTTNSSLKEIAGPAALTFEAGDVTGLSRHLPQVAKDLEVRARCAASGLVHSSRFSWESTAEDLLQLYRQVLKVSAWKRSRLATGEPSQS